MIEDVPNCVFCGAPWSAEMVRLYDAASTGAPCACCMPFLDEAWEPPPVATPPEHVVLPPELCCTTCGRVLYHLATPVGLDDDIAPAE